MIDLNKLNNKQFALMFNKIVERIKEDPIENFIKARAFIDLDPSPAQEVIFKVVFQKTLDSIIKKEVNIESVDSEGNFFIINHFMTEVEIYEYLTDKKYSESEYASIKINKINLICGRRSGKTLLAAVLSIYCAISNNWKPFLRKTPFATVLILSHSKEFSEEVLEVIKSLIEDSSILSRLINRKYKQTASTMNLKVPWIVDSNIDYSRVQIKVGAASSKTTRGIAACSVLCDEIAYWNLDENMKETDSKILKAVTPSLMQFGKQAILIKLSSPGIRQGVLHNEYKKDRENKLPKSYAVFKAPSWMMNNIIPKEEFIEEWLKDPDAFDTEYRANFADSLSNFMSPELIDLSIQKGIKFLSPIASAELKYFAAIDAAFKADRFTFSLVSIQENKVIQHIIKGWEGSRQEPIKAHEVAKYIKTIIKDFPVEYIASDQFAFQPLKEIFDQYNLSLKEYTFSNTFKKKIYFNLKKLIHSKQIELLDHEEQVKELKELIVEQSATGAIKIGHPAGGHDDFSDSLGISAYLATQDQSLGKFEFENMSSVKSYNIKTDLSGKAFSAPSPELLMTTGHLSDNIIDNSESYGVDPTDGKLKKVEEFKDLIEEDEGPNFTFG